MLRLKIMVAAICLAAASKAKRVSCPPKVQGSCEAQEMYFEDQLVDHFSWGTSQRWSQRYFTSDSFFEREQGPIFLYAGNEANVEAYFKSCGLMWERAPEFSALLVFVEHRYYGASQPVGASTGSMKDPSFLTVEQALADYAIFIAHLRRSIGRPDAPVIAFGGSYGGMLVAWLRLKYPHLVQGAIAASAPIGAFISEFNHPSYDPTSFWAVVTRDATPKAGAAANCAGNVKRTFEVVFDMAKSEDGLAGLNQAFSTCKPLKPGQGPDLGYWIQGAFDAFAMGNYPYPSDYIGGTAEDPLPAWPMRAACNLLNQTQPSDSELLLAMRAAMNLLYNATKDVPCYEVGDLVGPAGPGMTWLYQWCTERMAQELPYFPSNGRTDMFWDQGPFDTEGIAQQCMTLFGVEPRPDWIPISYGGFNIRSASNIVFSNGLYDPWSSGGVLEDLSDSLIAVIIPEGAHHLDLMFSHPDDPPSVTKVRDLEAKHIRRWLAAQPWSVASAIA